MGLQRLIDPLGLEEKLRYDWSRATSDEYRRAISSPLASKGFTVSVSVDKTRVTIALDGYGSIDFNRRRMLFPIQAPAIVVNRFLDSVIETGLIDPRWLTLKPL